MRYWFTIFLLIFMPLQAAWSAAGSYCLHESGASAQHFGHHDHRHQANTSDADQNKSFASALALDSDCDFCHPCCGAIPVDELGMPDIVLLPIFIDTHPDRPPSAFTSLPERPNWTPHV